LTATIPANVRNRKGARPFDLEEQRRLYLRDGKLWTITDVPPGPAATRAADSVDASTRD
jgi:hypothetical protein